MSEQQYDAFISYRHLPLDHAVAERIQTLLENYKVPFKAKEGQKDKIGRIFRDQSELPTSGNLDDSLKRALNNSQFLIVVLSKNTKQSKWCMEEIRSFKEAHGGSISHILPILVDGEPDESIPDILRYETRKVINPDGTVVFRNVEVEPLCCDVRAESITGSIKKLKTEFLRLCAPMLGVGFDDLYQRHARRRKKITTIAATTIGVLSAIILSIILCFAFQTYRANQKQTRNLVDSYAKQGVSYITEKDYEQALMYFSEALSLDNKTQTAKTGALLLLQQCGWLNHTSNGSGLIVNDILNDSDISAIAVDSAKEKFLKIGKDGTFTVDKNSTILDDLSSYGKFISSAQNGSYWTFATDDKITFYFTEDSSVAQVERPKAINPKCSREDTELYSSSDDTFLLNAMAINRTKAVVCYGGYLYIYNLNKNDINGKLCETFDLSLIFEKTAKNGIMSLAYEMWVDAGRDLCVVSDLSSVAVFSITGFEKPCLTSIYEFYGRTLKNVAFSSDGQYYAMVYGNDTGILNNPGGCIEVFDKLGKLHMATDFDGNTPLSGAAFEKDGNRIAAWGSGELQIWNWSTGVMEAAPIKIKDISSAVWLDDKSLAVSDGKGTIQYYDIVHYETNDIPIELEKYEEQDYYQNDFELSLGYHIKYDANYICTTDANAKLIDNCNINKLDIETMIVNRMFVDDKHNTAYLWNSTSNSLLRVTINKKGKISSVVELNTQKKNPLAIHSVWNGVLAEMGTGELFYYENGKTDALCTLNPNTTGSIKGVASNDSGLVSFIIRNKQYIDGYSFEFTYSVELWDLNKNILLAEFEKNSKEEISDLTFYSDKYLLFSCANDIKTWLLDAPTPNDKTVNTLKNMSCYTLDETADGKIADVVFDPEKFGNWNNLLHISSEQDKKTDLTFTQKMNNILKEQGTEQWLKEYNEWWSSKEPETIEDSELSKIMKNFLNTAIELGQEDKLRSAIEKYIDILDYEKNPDYISSSNIYDIIFYTPENIDLVLKYYNKSSTVYENLYKENGDTINLVSGLSFRVCAGIIQGQGTKVFDFGNDEMGKLYKDNMDILLPYGFNIYINLLNGKPEEAAKNCDDLSTIQDASDYILLFKELVGYVKLGAISEKDYSTFVSSLKYTTGFRITHVTNEQLKAGLRLNDMVIAANGIYIGMQPFYDMLREKDSINSITIKRNDSVFTMKVNDNWQLC